jgi:OOP family OmpA-OmpF porin
VAFPDARIQPNQIGGRFLLDVYQYPSGKGANAYNQSLSEARARSVVSWLTRRGVAPNRLTARGYGKTRPVASNDTDEGSARSRRVEVANLACKTK